MVGFLAALLLPALTRAKSRAQAIVCLSNLKQLTLAWNMYVEENNDWLVPNNSPNHYADTNSWALGDVRYGNGDGTNLNYLIGNHSGSLGPYVKTHQIFKCPSDRSTTTLGDGKVYPRVRTYSMNGFMGGRILDNGGTAPAATFLRREEFTKAGRPELLVFADVHEDFLDVCIFHLDRGRLIEIWGHLPASRHNGRG